MASDTSAEALNVARYSAYMNGRYHADREAFLDRTHRALMFLVIMFGASAFSSVVPQTVAPYFGALTASLGAADLVLNLSVRARAHASLREHYFSIAAQLEKSDLQVSDAQAKMTELSGKEEPVFYASHAIAQNWAFRAVYGGSDQLPCIIKRYHRVFAHLFRFSSTSFDCV